MSELNKKTFSIDDFQWKTQRIFGEKCDIRTLLPNFQALRSNYERVYFAYDILKEHNFLPDVIQAFKNDEEAKKRKHKGNLMFTEKNYHEAMQSYNDGITYAKSKKMLASMYECRSVVFFEVKLYEECLQDIQYAFVYNYPKKLREQLNKRKQQVELMISQSKSRIMQDYFTELPSLARGKSNYFQCASNQVEIKYSKKFGRHVIARKDIEPGDVIAIEKPYVQILLHEHRLTHCSHCLKLAYNLIPCSQCPLVMYCGKPCRRAAWDQYHQYECSILKTLLSMHASKVHLLALRVVLCARNEFSAVLNRQIPLTEELPIYKEQSYEEIHNLITNEEHRSEEDLFGRSLVAAFLLRLVESTKFLNGCLDADDMKKCAADLLLHHLQTATINADEIRELCGGLRNEHKMVTIGGGMYAFMSLLNHGCFSNITQDHYGTTVVLRAKRSISKGQQLLINYGYYFTLMTRKARQIHLKEQYYFTCDCVACINDWSGTFRSFTPFFRLIQIVRNSRAFINGDRQLVIRLIPDLLEQIKRLERHFSTNLENMNDTLELLQQCFAILANKHTKFLSK